MGQNGIDLRRSTQKPSKCVGEHFGMVTKQADVVHVAEGTGLDTLLRSLSDSDPERDLEECGVGHCLPLLQQSRSIAEDRARR